MKKLMERKKDMRRRKPAWRRVLKERSLNTMPRTRSKETKATPSHVFPGGHLGWEVMERPHLLISHP
jgi:hypothetical protein